MSRLVSIIMPVYNEEAYVGRCLENVVNVELRRWEKEIVIYDDGSKDQTLRVVEDFIRKHKREKIKLIKGRVNKGKGAGIRKGIKQAKGEVIIIQDADLEYDPNDYEVILKKFETERVGVVYGSRIKGAKIYHNYDANKFYLWGGIVLTKIVNRLFGVGLTDQPTGYKAFRKELGEKLVRYGQAEGFDFEVEMTACLSRETEIVEVPIHYYPRSARHGKKIRFSDFVKSVVTGVRCRLND